MAGPFDLLGPGSMPIVDPMQQTFAPRDPAQMLLQRVLGGVMGGVPDPNLPTITPFRQNPFYMLPQIMANTINSAAGRNEAIARRDDVAFEQGQQATRTGLEARRVGTEEQRAASEADYQKALAARAKQETADAKTRAAEHETVKTSINKWLADNPEQAKTLGIQSADQMPVVDALNQTREAMARVKSADAALIAARGRPAADQVRELVPLIGQLTDFNRQRVAIAKEIQKAKDQGNDPMTEVINQARAKNGEPPLEIADTESLQAAMEMTTLHAEGLIGAIEQIDSKQGANFRKAFDAATAEIAKIRTTKGAGSGLDDLARKLGLLPAGQAAATGVPAPAGPTGGP